MPANPIEIVLYLTARNETYRVLDGLSGQFRNIGANVSGLRAAMQDADTVAQRMAQSIQRTAAAQVASGAAMRDWTALTSLQARGIMDSSSALDNHTTAVTRNASALSRLRAVQGEIAVAQNTQIRVASDLATIQATAASRVAAIPTTGAWRSPVTGRFVSPADRQTMINNIQAQAAADAAIQQQAIIDAQDRERRATASAQRISPIVTTRGNQLSQAERDAAAYQSLDAAGSGTPSDAARRRTVSDQAERDAQQAESRAQQALLANEAGIGRFALPLALTGGAAVGLAGGAFYAHAIGQYDQFQSTIAQTKALGDTSLTDAQLRQVEDMVLQTSLKTGMAPLTGAQAEYYIASAGVKPLQSQGILQAAESDTFVSGDKDATTAARALVNILNAYKMDPKQVGKVNDELISAVRVANATFSNFAQGMGSVLASAPAAKVPFGDVAAAVASMTIKGVSPTESAQDVGSLIRSVTTNVPKGAWNLARQLGIPMGPDAFSKVGGDQPLTDWMKLFEQKTGGDIMVQRALLGNVRSMRALEDTGAGGAQYQSQFVDAVVHAIPGAAQDAFTTMAQTQAGKTQLAMAPVHVAVEQAGREAQGLWGAVQQFAAPGLVGGAKLGGFLAEKTAGGIGDFGNMLTNLRAGKLTSYGGLDPSAPMQQGDFYRSLNDFIAGNSLAKDRYQPSTHRDSQDVPYGNVPGTTQTIYSDSELDKWAKARDALQADVAKALTISKSQPQFQTMITTLEKGNPQYAQGINAYANTLLRAGAQRDLEGQDTIPTGQHGAMYGGTGAMAPTPQALAALKRLHDMGVAQERQQATEAGHQRDWTTNLTQYNIASGQAQLNTAIDMGAPTKEIQRWVDATVKQIAKTPLNIQSARVTANQELQTRNTGLDAIRAQQAAKDQANLQIASFQGTAQQALAAQDKAIQTDIDYYKKKGNLAMVAVLKNQQGLQGMISAAAVAQEQAGAATQIYSHDQAMGRTGQMTITDIARSEAADIVAAQKSQGTPQQRANRVTIAQNTADERRRNYDLQQLQASASQASTTLSTDQSLGASLKTLDADIEAQRKTAIALAKKTGGQGEQASIDAANSAATIGHHQNALQAYQAAAAQTADMLSTDQSLGASLKTLDADIEAQRKAAIALAQKTGGAAEAGSILAANNAALVGHHQNLITANQVAQQGASEALSFAQSMSADPATIRADIEAQRKAAISGARLAGGPGEANAETAANDAAQVALRQLDTQNAQTELNAAQTKMDAVQFEYGSIQDQKAAIAQWVTAARALATIQAGGNKTLLGQLLAGVNLQGQQMTRNTTVNNDSYIIQSAQLQFDSALRNHASSDVLMRAAQVWGDATEADIKARGLKGDALKAAEAQKNFTEQGMVMQAYQQKGQEVTDTVSLAMAQHKSYGLVKADVNAASSWIMANYKNEGISLTQAELQVANLKNTELGYYRPMNPPTYVDRPYQQAVGNLDTGGGMGSEVMFFGGQHKASSQTLDSYVKIVEQLQIQLAVAQQAARYWERIADATEETASAARKGGAGASNPVHPGPGGMKSSKSFGVSAAGIGGY